MRPLLVLTFLVSLPASGPAAAADDLVLPPRGAEDDEKKAEPTVDDSQPPAPQKELAKLFNGSWRCDGKANTELAADLPTKVTMSFKSDIGGRWITARIEEQKSKMNPRALSSDEVWGYSDALGGFVRNGADNQGGFYAGTSTGWVGDRFWWTTETAHNGKRVKLKDTFTKVSDKELTFERALDTTGTGDAYRVVYEGSCKR